MDNLDPFLLICALAMSRNATRTIVLVRLSCKESSETAHPVIKLSLGRRSLNARGASRPCTAMALRCVAARNVDSAAMLRARDEAVDAMHADFDRDLDTLEQEVTAASRRAGPCADADVRRWLWELDRLRVLHQQLRGFQLLPLSFCRPWPAGVVEGGAPTSITLLRCMYFVILGARSTLLCSVLRLCPISISPQSRPTCGCRTPVRANLLR